jgi:hypothetical protein
MGLCPVFSLSRWGIRELKTKESWAQWLVCVIPATGKVGIGRIKVQVSGQKDIKNAISINYS